MTGNLKKRKLNNKGYTLVEMLAALAILVFFGTIITLGVNVALKTYQQMTLESHYRVLQDDINTAFGGLVRSSTFVQVDGTPNAAGGWSSAELYFRSDQYSATLGFGSMVVQQDDPNVDAGYIYLIAKDTRTKEYTDCPLVSPGAYDNLKVSDVSISCTNEGDRGVVTLSYKICSSDGTMRWPKDGTACTCTYRTVNTNKVEGLPYNVDTQTGNSVFEISNVTLTEN